MKKTQNYELIPYQIDDTKTLEVTQIKDDVWLTQRQMAQLFDCSIDNISLHLKNIFQSNELDKNSTVEDFSVVQNEGGKMVKRKQSFYNLDAIISVGYRVNSKRGVMFRQWAAKIIKERIKQEYAKNKKTKNDVVDKFLTIKKERAKKIKHLLLINQITQQQISKELGLSYVSVSNAINGKTFSVAVENWLKENLNIYEDEDSILDGIKSEYKFRDNEIDLLRKFFNGGRFLRENVLKVIKYDCFEDSEYLMEKVG